MNELKKQLQEAVKLRSKIFDIIMKEWFTTNELVNKSNIGHEQAKEMLTHLGEFAFLKTESRDKKWKHKLIYDTEERKKMIEQSINQLNTNIQFLLKRVEYLKEMKDASLLIKA